MRVIWEHDQFLGHAQFELEHLCISAQLLLCSVVHEGDFGNMIKFWCIYNMIWSTSAFLLNFCCVSISMCSLKVASHAETLFAHSNLGLRPRFSLASLELSRSERSPHSLK